jgi:hypothetical protein
MKVLIDGGSALNILFTGALTELGLSKEDLTPFDSPFRGLYLPIQFGTIVNFRTEYVNFLVADFDTAYHAILGHPALAKFMAIPHYTYLVLKMSAPEGVLTL